MREKLSTIDQPVLGDLGHQQPAVVGAEIERRQTGPGPEPCGRPVDQGFGGDHVHEACR